MLEVTCVPKENGWTGASKLQQEQTKLQFVAAAHRESHLVCGRPKFVPTPTRGRLWTTFLTVATSGRLNMKATAEAHEQREELTDEYFHSQFLPFRVLLSSSPLFLGGCLKKINILGFLITSVGHEDFHCGVLQQVSSGKDGPDLCEQPFPVKSLRVGEYLESGERTWLIYGWENGQKTEEGGVGSGRGVRMGKERRGGREARQDHFSPSEATTA